MDILDAAIDAWRSFSRRLECARAARQLSALSDHQLEDIGIARDQIPAYVSGELCRNGTRAARPAVWSVTRAPGASRKPAAVGIAVDARRTDTV